MRQQRWLEFLAAYDFEIEYTLGKGYRVADALSRKHVAVVFMMIIEWNDLEILSTCNVRPKSVGGFSGAMLSSIVARTSLIEWIAVGQRSDPILVNYIQQLEKGNDLHSMKHYEVDL